MGQSNRIHSRQIGYSTNVVNNPHQTAKSIMRAMREIDALGFDNARPARDIAAKIEKHTQHDELSGKGGSHRHQERIRKGLDALITRGFVYKATGPVRYYTTVEQCELILGAEKKTDPVATLPDHTSLPGRDFNIVENAIEFDEGDTY